uniref:Uncharacterized protein n=1 Tax=Oryza nivara TaxID=4536 RepID=A0A0E0IVR3_ORYNI
MGTPAGRRKQRHGREGGTDERDRGQRGRRKLRPALKRFPKTLLCITSKLMSHHHPTTPLGGVKAH